VKTKIIAALTILVLLATCSAELFGQKKKKIKEKRFEVAVKQSLQDYEGSYTGIEPSYVIEIRVGKDGELHVTSLEENQKATLENLKLEGAHMTATKIYRDGHTEKFDATFSNRILNGVSAFGILVEGLNLNLEGLSLNRIFYRRTSSSH
jgi:hypothetical protein